MTIIAASIPILRALVVEVKKGSGSGGAASQSDHYVGRLAYISQPSRTDTVISSAQPSWGGAPAAPVTYFNVRYDLGDASPFGGSTTGIVKTDEVLIHYKSREDSVNELGDLEMLPRSPMSMF